jgi:hypothetical protein
MKNVVITPAVGLKSNEVEFFIKSLRKYYKDDIYFLVGEKDDDLKRKLTIYNCKFKEVKAHKYDIQLKRYKYFLKILEENKNIYNQVLFCDCRDIYFQSDPFDYKYNGSINFFLEDILFSQCSINSQWLIKTFGKNIYEEFKNNIVCCGGTILAALDDMIKWLRLMDNLILKYPFKKRLKYLLTFRRDKNGRGCDQAHGNFIVYKKYFKDSCLYSNHEGPIATVYYLKKIKFNGESQLINELGKPYLIVHQYDKRWSEFSEKVKLIKKNLKLI